MIGRNHILVFSYFLVAALPPVGRVLKLPDRQLHGEEVEEQERVPFSLRELSTDKERARWAKGYENAIGFRGVAIAVDNAILYHVFRETKQTSEVMVGKNGVLLAKPDVRYDIWRRELLPDPDAIEIMVDEIARIQVSLRKKRRAFVPILVPPKTLLWLDSIPDAARLGVTAATPPPAAYRATRAALERHGVRFVDMRPELSSLEAPREALWGRDARHWSSYSACLAFGRILEEYAALLDRVPPPHHCTFDLTPSTRNREDDDMAEAINVPFRPRPRATPVAVFDPPAPGERPNVLFVATSFGWGMARAARGFGFSDYLVDYYSREFATWPLFEQRPAVAGSDDWRKTVGERELIVLDLFEPYLPEQPSYARQFVDDYLQVFGEE